MNFRCPECHMPMRTAEQVHAHRSESQGECIGWLTYPQQRAITKYRRIFKINESDLAPMPPYEDPLIDLSDNPANWPANQGETQ